MLQPKQTQSCTRILFPLFWFQKCSHLGRHLCFNCLTMCALIRPVCTRQLFSATMLPEVETRSHTPTSDIMQNMMIIITCWQPQVNFCFSPSLQCALLYFRLYLRYRGSSSSWVHELSLIIMVVSFLFRFLFRCANMNKISTWHSNQRRDAAPTDVKQRFCNGFKNNVCSFRYSSSSSTFRGLSVVVRNEHNLISSVLSWLVGKVKLLLLRGYGRVQAGTQAYLNS